MGKVFERHYRAMFVKAELVLALLGTAGGKTVEVQEWKDSLSCQGSPDITPSYPDRTCRSGNPYYLIATCDADNMALHFQTYKDSACSQLVPDGAQSIATNQCTTIFGVGQIYTCADSLLNATATTETIIAKNALSASSIGKTETLV